MYCMGKELHVLLHTIKELHMIKELYVLLHMIWEYTLNDCVVVCDI